MAKPTNRTRKTPLEENIKHIKSKLSSCKNPPAEIVELVEALSRTATVDPAKDVVIYASCSFPGPRRFSSLAYNNKNLYFYGGEHDDGKNAKAFSDTIIANLNQLDSCKKLSSEVFPLLRSGHAMASFEGGFFIHGGEFLFDDINFCYNDLWFFDYAKKRWFEIELTGNVPAARSGHRMTYHQGIIFISCGYSMLPNGVISIYHNDLYAIKPTTGECRQVNVQMKGRIFTPRSGCLLTSWNDKIIVLGGYSLLDLSENNLQGSLSNEMWQSDISHIMRLFSEHSNQVIPAELERIRWEKIPKTFFYRCAIASTVNKGLLYMFGGVIDDDRGGLNHQIQFVFLFGLGIRYSLFYIFETVLSELETKYLGCRVNLECLTISVEQ
ncbi:kelch domain-containing protein 4-like [Dermatophagoides farinae]|uniref:kelch domain-containing protein 4-like n=1 Tax=Dermatophagoides farinae TaxID=6954 RepID=UPI003F5E6584